MGWLETLLTLQGVTVTPQSRLALHRALELLATGPSRTITDLVHTVQDDALRHALTPYTLQGPAGRLLDGDRESLDDNVFQVFELDHVATLGDKNLIPVLLYLFRRVQRRLEHGHPALIALGEAWLALSHPSFRDEILKWLKTLRKKNAAVILETQNTSDVTNSPIRDVIIESCQTKIFLPNAEARTEHSSRGYEALGLRPKEIDLIARAVPKRHYYYTSPYGRRLFELGLGPVAQSFLGVGGPEDLATARALIARHGDTWPAEWLKYRGQAKAARRWRSLLPKTSSPSST
jgi:type IV secretion system protein VirB4